MSVLGQGGFGITYRAHDTQLDREVAIKEYLPLALAVRQDGTTVLPRSTDAAADFSWGRDRFVAEGRTLASLQRAPAIVRVFDFLEANGTAYIVMELLHGETLEHRLKQKGSLGPAEIDRILWPLLDGLEQVHATGFLHRDIKPANILLDAAGNPTLIDFGASRAAMAGRSVALTAIFTPGYAAAEQMTSAKQGPWTDIYGLSATLYHAITGAMPPSAFDRMLGDAYEPLGGKSMAGFAPGLLVGIDAGLAVRASDRPQSIAGWRPILGQTTASDAQATVAMVRQGGGATTVVSSPKTAAAVPAEPARRGMGLWLGAAAAAILVAAGGYFGLVNDRQPTPSVVAVPAVATVDKAAQEAQAAAEAKRLQDQEDLAKLRAEAEARQKADAEAAVRRQIEEETRLKIAAEEAEKKQLEDEARQKADAEVAAKHRAEEEEKKTAEVAEGALRLTTVDRQHVQVALPALGFATGGTDGTFGLRTREMIGAWQKGHGMTPTGFLTGAQNQAMLKEAAPAIAKFDDEQRKAAEAQAKPPSPPPPATAPPQVAAAMPPSAAPAVAAPGSTDGVWQGSYACEAGIGGNGEAFTIPLRIGVKGGTGTWTNPGSRGALSVTVQISGTAVRLTRMVNLGQTGQGAPVNLNGQLLGSTISASGREAPFGRHCVVNLVRLGDVGAVPPPTPGSATVGGGGGGGRRQRN
ncbi:MAG: protein kinase [Reyranella sp.]|nr:protein kinase [Reyranella sp.]